MVIELSLQDVRQNQDSPIPSRADFIRWVRDTLADQVEKKTMTIRIVDSKDMRSLNRQYRGKDQPTNVLAFTYDGDDQFGSLNTLLGDVVICADEVKREADQMPGPISHHWAHLTIHGVLHLLGYDHQNDAQAAQMQALEIDLLSRFNIPNPYAPESVLTAS